MFKDKAFNRCWSKYYKEHSWNYMDEELSSDLAYYFWKSALEQPTNMVTIPLDKLEDMQHRLKEQPTQEPVAWMHCVDEDITEFNDFQACPKCEPLYTHPKEWQGLSDDELEELSSEEELMFWGFARAIEAKLKEKNNA